jgi:simple sugar transport system ATP-binding protein
MSMEEMVALELRNVSKAFPGVQALSDVSLSVRKGEIHCLVGENGSGKSTLIRCISGVEQPDTGQIVLNGHTHHHLSTHQAMQEGVQVIYQDLSLFPDLSVAENIAFTWLKREGKSFIAAATLRSVAQKALDRLQLTLDLDEEVQNLSMSERQIVAIARAIMLDAKCLILDEPTTALTKREIDMLLGIIQDLKQQQIATIFVSHKLDEVFRVADNITVLRDGRKIGDFEAASLDENTLSHAMTGRDIRYRTFEPTISDGETLLEARRLTRRPHFEDVSFSIRAGEIVGLTGPLGAGRTELALALFGLNRPQSGDLLLRGRKVRIDSPKTARDLGLALLPEDRRSQGLFPAHSISDNLVAAVLDKLRTLFMLRRARLNATSGEWFTALHIKAPSAETLSQALSGGNQQRVVLGKWLAAKPRLFIMDSPTVGIDVGSKSEIHQMMQELAAQGMAILLISDEIPEVFHNSNRVMVMREGRIVADLDVRSTTESALRQMVEGKAEA